MQNAKTMQTKVLEALLDKGISCNLDPVMSEDGYNTGVIYFQRGWETVLKCKYDFQVHVAQLQFTPLQKPTNENIQIDTRTLQINFEDMKFVMEKVMSTIAVFGK